MQMWEKKEDMWSRVLMDPGNYHVCVEERVLCGQTVDLLKGTDRVCGYYIVQGTLLFDGRIFEKDTFLWFTAGDACEAKTVGQPLVIFIGSERKRVMGEPVFQQFDEEKIPWSRPLSDGMTASRHMIRAEDWGVKIQTCIYTKDFHHERHSHSAAHGFYVLEGLLYWQTGDGEPKIFGPGGFVVSGTDIEMLHEVALGCPYCRYLFIGDGPFDFIVNGVNTYGA